jgi:hypothetical protein
VGCGHLFVKCHARQPVNAANKTRLLEIDVSREVPNYMQKRNMTPLHIAFNAVLCYQAYFVCKHERVACNEVHIRT